MLYPLLGNYHKVMSITAQALGHGYGLSNSLYNDLAHPMPLNLYHSHSSHLSFLIIWTCVKLWPHNFWPLIYTQSIGFSFPIRKVLMS